MCCVVLSFSFCDSPTSSYIALVYMAIRTSHSLQNSIRWVEPEPRVVTVFGTLVAMPKMTYSKTISFKHNMSVKAGANAMQT